MKSTRSRAQLKAHNAKQFLCRMPKEIILCMVGSRPGSSKGFMQRGERSNEDFEVDRNTMASVCSQLRNDMISTPSLWSHVAVRINSENYTPPGFLQLKLSRACPLPSNINNLNPTLELHLELGTYHPSALEVYPNIIAPYFPHIKTLVVRAAGQSVPSLGRVVDFREMEALQYLCILAERPSSIHPLTSMLLSELPTEWGGALQTLVLRDLQASHNPHLIDLAPYTFTRGLRRLCISGPNSAASICRFVIHCPNLEVVTIMQSPHRQVEMIPDDTMPLVFPQTVSSFSIEGASEGVPPFEAAGLHTLRIGQGVRPRPSANNNSPANSNSFPFHPNQPPLVLLRQVQLDPVEYPEAEMEHLLLTHRDITSLSLNNPDIELVVQPGAWQPPTFQLDRITNCLRVLSTPAAGGVMRHPNLQSLYLNLCGSYPSSLEALSAIKESLQAVRAIHPTIRILAMYSDHSVRDEFPEISFMEVHELHDAALEDWELPWTHYELKCMGRMWV